MSLSPSAIRVPLLLALLLVLAPLWAQDTRGALVPDTGVLLADGTTAMVQDLDSGQFIWTLGPDGKSLAGKVTNIRRQHADSYLLVRVGSREVQATGSHRIAVPGGRLVRIDTLKKGDLVLVWGKAGPLPEPVTSIRLYPANLVAYDLTVEGHRPFRVGELLLGD